MFVSFDSHNSFSNSLAAFKAAKINCKAAKLNKFSYFFNHPDNVCFGTPYFFDMEADDSPFSTSFSILYSQL